MRTPEAEFAVKSQPFSTKCEYNLFVTGECRGWKEVNTTGFYFWFNRDTSCSKKVKYIFLLVAGKSKVHNFDGTCCSVTCGDFYVCRQKCHVFHP
jgi:hypothetical protein